MRTPANNSLVERIADAVLYEGYILYPYRPSAIKNQQRWNFGVLCPQSYSLAQRGSEASSMQTECLVEAQSGTSLAVTVRFLHLVTREVGELIADCQMPIAACGHREAQSPLATSHFQVVRTLEVNGQLWQTWQEALEREVYLTLDLNEIGDQPQRLGFAFPGSRVVEALRDESSGELVGVIIRSQQAIDGSIELRIANCEFRNENHVTFSDEPEEPAIRNSQFAIRNSKFAIHNLFRVTVRILNLTQFPDAEQKSRDEALLRSLVSTHTILRAESGQFVSLLDPPEPLREAAAGCRNVGTYPVLVGTEGERHCLLSSPIILYDYPQIAPESAGNLYDGTEIDEILTLRIMTLTEEEKREMRSSDERARQILERTETLPLEQLMKLHGAMKGRESKIVKGTPGDE